MKKLVILLVLLAAAGTAVWLIYRKTPSGPEDKAVLYGNVDLRQVDLRWNLLQPAPPAFCCAFRRCSA